MKYFRFTRFNFFVILLAWAFSGSAHSETLSSLQSEVTKLEEKIAACEDNIEYLNESIKRNFPSLLNSDGTWTAPPPQILNSQVFYPRRLKILLEYLDKAQTCIKQGKRKLAVLKKKINKALTVSTTDSAKENPPGGLPRGPLLELKDKLLLEQALLNHLDAVRKSMVAVFEALEEHGSRESD